MKKALSMLLTVALLLSLCACGGSKSAPASVSSEFSPATEEPVPASEIPEEKEMTAEEIIAETQRYIEEAGMAITDIDVLNKIQLIVYSGDSNDPYEIFLSLVDGGYCVPAADIDVIENDDDTSTNGYVLGGGPVFIFTENKDYKTLKQLSLQQLDVKAKEFTQVFSFVPTNSFSYHFTIPLDADALTGRILEQLFSPDLTKMAINWYDGSDNSKHVGWVDYTGQIVDITKEVTGSLSEFSKRPQHDRALFDPNGNFFYLDENAEEYHIINTETFEDIEVKTIKQDIFKNTYIGYDDDLMFSPLGDLMKGASKINNYKIISFPFSNGTYVSDGYSTTSNVADYIGDTVAIFACNYNGIRKAGEGYGTPDNYNRYSSSENESVQILPETDFDITNAAYSNGKIIFTATRGSDKAIFIMNDPPLGELGNPERVTNLPNGAKLAFWKDIN